MFWGVVLILAGLLMLLSKLEILDGGFWEYFWPVLLIALGVKVLFDKKSDKIEND